MAWVCVHVVYRVWSYPAPLRSMLLASAQWRARTAALCAHWALLISPSLAVIAWFAWYVLVSTRGAVVTGLHAEYHAPVFHAAQAAYLALICGAYAACDSAVAGAHLLMFGRVDGVAARWGAALGNIFWEKRLEVVVAVAAAAPSAAPRGANKHSDDAPRSRDGSDSTRIDSSSVCAPVPNRKDSAPALVPSSTLGGDDGPTAASASGLRRRVGGERSAAPSSQSSLSCKTVDDVGRGPPSSSSASSSLVSSLSRSRGGSRESNGEAVAAADAALRATSTMTTAKADATTTGSYYHVLRWNPILTLTFTTNVLYHALGLWSYQHPFVRDDNRHFTFYLWRRVLAIKAVRQALAPVYVCAAVLSASRIAASHEIPTLGWAWVSLWAVASAIVLVPSRLLEPRYFLVPVTLALLHTRYVSNGGGGVFITMLRVHKFARFLFLRARCRAPRRWRWRRSRCTRRCALLHGTFS